MEHTFWRQIQKNSLSILSLLVALSALSYNTWRNEATEKNRNIRAAEFEMLRHLVDVQQIIDYAHLRQDQQKGDLTQGLNRVLLVHDLSTLTPKNVEQAAEKLRAQWVAHSDKLSSNREVASNLSEEVWQARQAVLESLRSLK
jgi:hypothetical protein